MKRIISSLTIMVIIATSIVYAASGDNGTTNRDWYDAGYQDGYNDGRDKASQTREPDIVFLQQDKMLEVNAGENFNLVVEYKNESDAVAREIKITPSYEDTPLVFERPITYESSKNLKQNASNTASFPFKVRDTAKNGVYNISFKISFKNSSNVNFTKTENVYFKVKNEKMGSVVTINHITTEPAQVVAGEPFTLRFDINNIGEMPMNDTRLRLTGLSTEEFMPVDGTDFTYIGKVAPNATVTKSFQMIASDKLSNGNHSLGAVVQYKDEDNQDVNVEKTLYILNVLNSSGKKDDEGTKDTRGKPKIMISSYSTVPNHIVAGDSFVFQFHFKNTSRDTTIQNMKVTIQSEDGAFMIANGSNTSYVEKLLPQAIMTNSIQLNVKQDLASKSYPITISFDYEDDQYNAYQSSETINIPVIEYSKLVINSAYANESFVGGQTSLSFDYINMGKAVVSNLTASVEGDYKAVQEINYIGNLEAGNSDYYDIQVTPTKEGENFGILVLSFEDSSGKKMEVKKDFTGMAMSESMMNDFPGDASDDPMMIPEEETPTYSVWQYIGWGVGSFLVSFILAKMITTKIVRKKLEDEI